MKETDMQSAMKKWIQYNWKQSSVFEYKICKVNKFNLKNIRLHQVSNLEQVNNGLFYYKIPDNGFDQKPFDAFCFYQQPAYVVIMWYKPRQPKIFYMIPIITIQGLIDDGIKSITEEDAIKLCSHSGLLK